LPQAFMRIAEGLPGGLIPEHYGTAPVFAFGNGAFEPTIIEGMILDMDRQALVGGVGRGSLGDGPALEHTVEFEPEIIVEPRRVVFLHDKAQTLCLALARRLA